MCLAIPVKVLELLDNDLARVELNGLKTDISLSLVEQVGVGDYVIVHVGYALSKLDPDEAEATLALMKQETIANNGETPQS